MRTFIYFFLRAIGLFIAKIFFRFKVYGPEMVPEKGGVIIAANHVSYIDPPVLAMALKRMPTYLAVKFAIDWPVVGWLIGLYSMPVEPGRTPPSTIKEAIRRLRRGEAVVIFPEGGRSYDGSFLDAQRGIGVIAAKSGVPVVPAFINGTYEVLPVGARFPRLARLEVFFGQPLKLEAGEAEEAFRDRVSGEIMDRIRALGRR